MKEENKTAKPPMFSTDTKWTMRFVAYLAIVASLIYVGVSVSKAEAEIIKEGDAKVLTPAAVQPEVAVVEPQPDELVVMQEIRQPPKELVETTLIIRTPKGKPPFIRTMEDEKLIKVIFKGNGCVMILGDDKGFKAWTFTRMIKVSNCYVVQVLETVTIQDEDKEMVSNF